MSSGTLNPTHSLSYSNFSDPSHFVAGGRKAREGRERTGREREGKLGRCLSQTVDWVYTLKKEVV